MRLRDEEDWPVRVASVQIEAVTLAGLLPSRSEAFRHALEHCTLHNSIRVASEITLSFWARERAA